MVKCSHCLLYVFCVTLVFSSYYFLFQIVINYLLLRILNNYFFSNYLFVLMYLFLLFLLVIDLFVITPDSLFFKTLNRIYSLSSYHKRMCHSLLDSPNQDASNGSKLMFLASI